MKIERIIADGISVPSSTVERSIQKEQHVLSTDAVVLDTDRHSKRNHYNSQQKKDEEKKSLKEELDDETNKIKRLGGHIDLIV